MPGASLDLDVLFTRYGAGYQAQVVRSPAGEGQSVRFERPFSELELDNLILRIGSFTGRTRRRRVEAPPVVAVKEAGGRLFDAVFSGAVGECLRRSLDRAQDAGAALRIRLRLADCGELADLPWELLYDRDDDWFLALSGDTPVMRQVQLPVRSRPVQVKLPLRILVIRSEPVDHAPLDLEAEWTQVAAALAQLSVAGLVTFTELAVPTLSELRRELQRDSYHVLHFMGHGGFDERLGGYLAFTDDAGRGVPITGGDLGVMLRDHVSMRLAVLNACQAGRSDPQDAFAGVADALVRRGVPAVVAMQFEVTDAAAVEFAPAMYGALASGRPVDAAVAEARKAMFAVSQLEWATPVLYVRGDDTRLFDIPVSRPAPRVPAVPRPVPVLLPGNPESDPAADGERLVLPVTQGGINNSYVALAGYLEFFPADAIGPADERDGTGTLLTLHFAGRPEAVLTDIAGNHKTFRRRFAWREFFARHQLTAGDSIAIERLSPGEYRVVPLPRLEPPGPAGEEDPVPGPSVRRQWDRDSFMRELAEVAGESGARVARRIFEWADERGDLLLWFGYGRKDGGFQPGLDNASGYLFPFALYTYGRVEIHFQYLQRQIPFDALSFRSELQRRLNAIPGVHITDQSLTRRPSIPLRILAEGDGIEKFLAVMDWSFEQAQAAASKKSEPVSPPHGSEPG